MEALFYPFVLNYNLQKKYNHSYKYQLAVEDLEDDHNSRILGASRIAANPYLKRLSGELVQMLLLRMIRFVVRDHLKFIKSIRRRIYWKKLHSPHNKNCIFQMQSRDNSHS